VKKIAFFSPVLLRHSNAFYVQTNHYFFTDCCANGAGLWLAVQYQSSGRDLSEQWLRHGVSGIFKTSGTLNQRSR